MTATTSRDLVREFRLPDLGEGLTESEIVQWHVAEGDAVELNQIIADVETAKAVVELPSPYAGVVVRLHEAAGTVVDVGAPIISFEVPGEHDDVPSAPDATSGAAAGVRETVYVRAGSPAKREPNLVGYGAAVEKGGRPQRRSRSLRQAVPGAFAPATQPGVAFAAPTTAAPATPTTAAAVVPPTSAERPRSTPPVRKLARDSLILRFV